MTTNKDWRMTRSMNKWHLQVLVCDEFFSLLAPVEIHTCIGCEGLTSGGVYGEIGIITWVAAYKLSPSAQGRWTYEHTD